MLYTSVLEAHIEVLQGLQKVAAYSEDMFNADEIDLHLTRQQERLIEEIVNKKFEDQQMGLDFIRPLIVKNKKLKVILPALTDEIYEPNMVYGVLPSNYYHLVNNRTKVVTSTAAGLCDDLTAYKALASSKTTYTEAVAVLTLPSPSNASWPFYYKTKLTLGTSSGNTEIQLPEGLNNLKSSNSWFQITNWILENVKIPNVDIYWESYRDTYAPKSFIFVSSRADLTAVTIEWQTSSSNSTLAGSATKTFSNIVYSTPNYTSTNLTGYKEDQISNLLTETDEFYTHNLNAFYKTSKKNPKTQVSGDFLLAYENRSFLISDLSIDYIRKPKHISLSLNQNFELAGDAPRIIVNRTTEFLKLAIENPSYQAVLNDNKVRNQI